MLPLSWEFFLNEKLQMKKEEGRPSSTKNGTNSTAAPRCVFSHEKLSLSRQNGSFDLNDA